MLENNRRTGEDQIAWARANKHYTTEGETASLAASGTENVFTPTAGEMYIITVKNSTNANSVSSVALVQGCNAGNHILTSLVSTGAGLSISSGDIRITNNLLVSTSFVWTIIRIQ